MPFRRPTTLLPLALALLVGGACARDAGLAPHVSYSPADVIRLQVEALAEGQDDQGIEVAFRFASPANKQSTGPLARFVAIVRAPAYLPMLNHLRAEYSPVMVEDGYAAQVVTILGRDGSRHRYLFELSEQQDGSLEGCWMTDSVRLLESEKVRRIEI